MDIRDSVIQARAHQTADAYFGREWNCSCEGCAGIREAILAMRPTKSEIVRDTFNKTTGRFFSLLYKKKDGTLRKFHGQLRKPMRHIRRKLPYNSADLITIFDLKIQQHRTIRLSNVKRFKSGHVDVTF